MAGPMSRVAWKTAALSEIAARSRAGGTTSVTNACLVGASNAKITPASSANAYTSAGCTAPAIVMTASAAVAAAFSSLRGEQDAPLRQPVGDRPGVQAEQQHRPELQRHRHADRGRAVRQAEDQPVLGDALHPRAGVGQALPAEVDPVTARGEGGEGALSVAGSSRRSSLSWAFLSPCPCLSSDILRRPRSIWNCNDLPNSYYDCL